MISYLLVPWVPLLTVWVALVLQEIALPFASWSVFRPDLVLICLFYWRLYRSDLCGPVLAFGVGLLLDITSGTPLGLNAFSKVVMVIVVGHFNIRLKAAEFMHLLPVMLLLVILDLLIQLLLFSILRGNEFYLPIFYGRPIATMLLMPMVVAILIHIQKSWLEYD
ncbi:MAG: rod shape-determining protein MreD [Magnetococcales bacterium]|nr:rod shape-determining protein MreD [Magnetococcales bacterium]